MGRLSLLRDPAAQGHLAMLGFSGLVAGSFALGGIMANDIAPVALTAVRFALTSVLIVAVLLVTGGLPRTVFRAPWRYAVTGGLFAIYFVLMFEGLKTASAVSTSAVFTLTPILAAGFGWWLLRQAVTPRIAFALTIGAMGALWVIFRADIALLLAFQPGRGEVVYFIGCIAHALYIPLVRMLNRGENAAQFTGLMTAAGALWLFAIGWQDLAQTNWQALPNIVWITLAYLVIGSSVFSLMLLQFASMRLPASKVMAYTFLTPSWVLIWETALGHGLPPLPILAGVGLSIAALLTLLRQEQSPPPPETSQKHQG